MVREYGVNVFLITARGPASTAIVESELGVNCSYATYGGALVLGRVEGAHTALSAIPLDEELVWDVIRAGLAASVHVGVYTQHDWFVNELNYWGLREARNTAIWPTECDLLSQRVNGFEPIYKIMFRGEAQQLEELGRRLEAHSDGAFIHHSNRVLEIIPATAVKLPALMTLATHHGLALDQVMAFGDSLADVPMLENSGVGVIMANASRDLDIASHVVRTLSHDEDGVGIALRKYFPTSEPFQP